MKIALAVDGSESANRSIAFLVNGTAWFRDAPQIEMVFVHLPMRPIGNVHGVAISDDALEQYYEEDARQQLADARATLESAKLSFNTHLLVGNPAEAICDFADKNKCDLILMGTRGMGTLANIFLGSTANKVLHLANIPVLLVPAHREPTEAFDMQTMRT